MSSVNYMCVMSLSNHLSQILIRPTSTPPKTHHSQHLTFSLGHLLHMSKLSQSILPHLVHHRSHFHLVPNIFIPNPISPSMSTHPFQRAHFRYFHLLDV
uniref:Putative ovule protein n=1 Tax=Solanum chacoense TaxID=4108 RepID=A0A0V0HZH2_SOLCH